MAEPDYAACAELVAQFEAFRPWVYDDARPGVRYTGGNVAGTLTIGYGETDPTVVQQYLASGASMTEAEARQMLADRLPGYWWSTRRYFREDLNPNQAAALTSIAYNAGGAGLALNAPATVEAINLGFYALAAERIRTSIIMVGSMYEEGLRRRRAAEADLFGTPWVGPVVDPWEGLFVPVLGS